MTQKMDIQLMEEITELFRKVKLKRISNVTLAQESGFNKATISGWRTGRHIPIISNFRILERAIEKLLA